MIGKIASLPMEIDRSFPVLKELTYIRQLSSLAPLHPDTVFYLFTGKSGQFFALVLTDHPDPVAQSNELLQLSERYKFKFTKLIAPYARTQTIEMDDIEESDIFYIPIADSFFRCYLAMIEGKFS